MKISITILFFFFSVTSLSQIQIKPSFIYKAVKLKSNKLYLFCRGTGSKLQLVTNSFNKLDTNITHVGIGYLRKKKPLIFNVTNTSGSQNAFITESLESFIGLDGTSYFCIWEYKCDSKEQKKIKNTLTAFQEKKIIFDYSFLLNNGDSLYCSEFCALVINSGRNVIAPTNKALMNSLYESILDRKFILYYPVDFFVDNRLFRKIYECRF